MKARSVLFVCMGNICRSPIAEGVFRARAEEAGIAAGMRIDSAGTHGYHEGHPPDRRAQKAAGRKGYDLSGLRARVVEPEDLGRFDLVVAMDTENLSALSAMAKAGGNDGAQLRLMCDFSERNGALRDVPDPYYGDMRDFETVVKMVEAAVDGLIGRLKKGHGKD